jgi:hypothetical protein
MGYWYPKGTSMGVARYKHERFAGGLTPEPKSAGVADILKGGYTSEQATLQSGGGFYTEDWNMILTAVVTRKNGNES